MSDIPGSGPSLMVCHLLLSTVQALYAKTHPDFASYLYLAAPSSLMLLNPLGFVLMELQRAGSSGKTACSSGKAAGSWLETGQRVLTGIGTNPVVFMTFLGIVANGVFEHCLPNILEGILKVGEKRLTCVNAFSSIT